MIVCAVDTTAIQSYIFSSNRLQENIGASHLVRLATDEWARAVLQKCGGVEVYAGGGNFVCHFGEEPMARDFVRLLSRKVLRCAPGLQLVIGQHERPDEQPLSQAVRCTFDDLALAKQCRPLPAPLLGLSVTRACTSTGLPANEGRRWAKGQELQWVSSEIAAKLDRAKEANRSLCEVFAGTLEGTGYAFPLQLDHLGRAFDEASHLAVVHADGNDMGRRIRAIGQEEDDEKYSTAIKEFSGNIKSAGQAALCDVIELLLHNLKTHTRNGNALFLMDASGRIRSRLELRRAKEGWFLPFRPLVFGGDDVTFVCDGRIGVSLAVAFLRAFEQRTQECFGEKITACAGVAIVPVHHPFSAAYNLSETLAASAKAYRREKGIFGSCFDWHLAEQGVLSSLGAIRTREYMNGNLTQRPVTLEANASTPIRSWPAIEKALRGFQGEWSLRRNKVKDLREALRDDSGGVKAFLQQSGVVSPEFGSLPDIGEGEDVRKNGWLGGRCAYYDAVELEDRHIFLEPPQTTSPAQSATSPAQEVTP